MFKNKKSEIELQLRQKFWVDVFTSIVNSSQNMPPENKINLGKMAANDALKHYDEKFKDNR